MAHQVTVLKVDCRLPIHEVVTKAIAQFVGQPKITVELGESIVVRVLARLFPDYEIVIESCGGFTADGMVFCVERPSQGVLRFRAPREKETPNLLILTSYVEIPPRFS